MYENRLSSYTSAKTKKQKQTECGSRDRTQLSAIKPEIKRYQQYKTMAVFPLHFLLENNYFYFQNKLLMLIEWVYYFETNCLKIFQF